MVTTHILGLPRIGEQRQLKHALEAFWQGKQNLQQLQRVGAQIRQHNWQQQQGLDFVTVGDFSFYDQVLDTSFLLGNLPTRVRDLPDSGLDNYFRVARGRSAHDVHPVVAGQMTKWFDSNYHYIVPEFDTQTSFSLHAGNLLAHIAEAKAYGKAIKPVILGPVSYLWLGKARDGMHKLDLLPALLPVYGELLQLLAQAGVEWVQIDEPLLACDLELPWQRALEQAYHRLQNSGVKLLLASYFGPLLDNLQLACRLPVAGLHVDAVNARNEVQQIIDWLPHYKVLSLGVINGRNIWKTDLNATLDWLTPIAARLQQRLWLAPSCSLLHVPVDLASETQLDAEIKSWLAFAWQKLEELQLLAAALRDGRASVAEALQLNAAVIRCRANSPRVSRPEVQQMVAAISPQLGQRHSPYAQRAVVQRAKLNLPLYPTTTIGSFPQTSEIRSVRQRFKRGELSVAEYEQQLQSQIAYAIEQQEKIGLDVLVHGEAERNDMVEYFGEQLDGVVFSQYGWVQSYGSRCVKPPIIFGDIQRPQTMTLRWIQYAQSLSNKPVKGMLTGPVTILNWSFVRDDLSRREVCYQLALAIRQEVLDLERAGVAIIQIDEAALREGLPLRKQAQQHYLDWAVTAFRLTANGVQDATQIHTHMCYSDFNEIIDAIVALDADVITIETSRSQKQLLDALVRCPYPNEIGPGVYDIHTPNTPSQKEMVELLQQVSQLIPAERLWVNPDCGLKTRRWEEVVPALRAMVAAARVLRSEDAGNWRLETTMLLEA